MVILTKAKAAEVALSKRTKKNKHTIIKKEKLMLIFKPSFINHPLYKLNKPNHKNIAKKTSKGIIIANLVFRHRQKKSCFFLLKIFQGSCKNI